MAASPRIRDHTFRPDDLPEPPALRDERLPLWISGLVLFSIVFIRLPLITGHSTVSRLIIISLFVAAASWTMSRRLPERISAGAVTALGAYLMLSGIAMLRGSSAGVYSGTRVTILEWTTVAVMALFILGLCASARTQAGFNVRLRLVLYAPAVYVATNILLRLFRNHLPFTFPPTPTVATGGKDELASFLGIQATRVTFPIALGLYNFGAIAAAGFGAAVVLAMRDRSSRRMPIIAAAVCLYGLLATDTRGPFFFALGTILLFAFWQRVRTSGGVALLLTLSPVIALTVLGFLAGSGYANVLSRGNGDIATANNRLFIWQTVFDFLKHPNFQQFVGYGANGQTRSHVSDGYAYLFGSSSDSVLYTAHNIALQTILDSGYIGLLVLVAAVIAGIKCLEHAIRSAPHSYASAALALLLILVLSGSLEAAPSYLFLDTFVLFVIALAAAAGSLPLPEEIDTNAPEPATVDLNDPRHLGYWPR